MVKHTLYLKGGRPWTHLKGGAAHCLPLPSSLSSPSAGTERVGKAQLHSFKSSLLFQCEITHVHAYSHAQIDHKQRHLQTESGAATAILTYVLSCAGAACPLLPSQSNVEDTGLSHRWPQYLKALGQRSNIHTDCMNTKPKRGRGTSILLLCWLLQFLCLSLVYAAYWKNVIFPEEWLSDVLLLDGVQAYSERMTP